MLSLLELASYGKTIIDDTYSLCCQTRVPPSALVIKLNVRKPLTASRKNLVRKLNSSLIHFSSAAPFYSLITYTLPSLSVLFTICFLLMIICGSLTTFIYILFYLSLFPRQCYFTIIFYYHRLSHHILFLFLA